VRQEHHGECLATSIDGRHFVFDVPVDRLDMRIGGYVVVEDGRRERRLGYVTEVTLAAPTERPDPVPGPRTRRAESHGSRVGCLRGRTSRSAMPRFVWRRPTKWLDGWRR
jgi:hypothetical protein